MAETRDVYMNRMQMLIFYAMAKDLWVEAARRFGKTDGVIGPRIWAAADSQPQGAGGFLGASRKQLFSRTVPGVIAAIERFYGMKEGTHFGWGKPPKGTPPCIIRPKSYENCLWFANGHLIHTLSLATLGSANGMTLNELFGDECKFLPKKKIDEEVMPALSGMVHPLGDRRFSEENPYYKSTCFVSDASLSNRGNWLGKGEEKMQDVVNDGGPCDGMTYQQIKDELDAYAGRVIFFNELLRSAKKSGHRVQVVSADTKERILALAAAVERREGQFRIIPRQYGVDTKGTIDTLLSYKLIEQADAELLYDYKYLITHDEQMEMFAIRNSKKYQKHINDLRCAAFYYIRASSLDNIDILGEDYIRRMKRDLPPLVFAISILNIRPKKSGEGFYCNFDPDIHTYIDDDCPAVNDSYKIKQGKQIVGGTAYGTEYESPDFDYLSNIKDCTLDGDLRDDLDLEVALDYNNLINWICIGQLYKRGGVETLNVINSMFVKNGGMIQDLIRDFDRYYTPHKKKNRKINYYYSHTAKFKLHGISMDDIKDTVIKELRKYGWEVNPIDMGQAPGHMQKYKDINEAFAGFGYPAIAFNKQNNEPLTAAVEQCDVKLSYGRNGSTFSKQKGGEKLSVDAQDATPEELRTDGTDAFDELYMGVKHFRQGFSMLMTPSGN
ncbi:MAG: hypothetical protein J6X07_08890 [Prevotella sp.]|nr:hypothetical protein [Prevotella sp.]